MPEIIFQNYLHNISLNTYIHIWSVMQWEDSIEYLASTSTCLISSDVLS